MTRGIRAFAALFFMVAVGLSSDQPAAARVTTCCLSDNHACINNFNDWSYCKEETCANRMSACIGWCGDVPTWWHCSGTLDTQCTGSLSGISGYCDCIDPPCPY
jgi:hypothetical protein